jgi:hypothetical protein
MSSPEPVILALRDGHGNSESLVLPGPGGTIRVVVGEPGRQSGLWRIWSNPNKFDVYIAVRIIAGYQKWSLHETGDWRFQWVSDDRARQFGRDKRIIDQWRRPEEIGQTGVTMGFSIRVRRKDLVEVADPEEVPADAVWLPTPPEGRVTGLHVTIARPNRGEFETTGMVPLGGLTLADGSALLLLVSVEPLSDEQDQEIDGLIAATVEAVKEHGVDLAATGNPRMALGGFNAEGHRFVWDVALPKNAPGV